MPYLKKKLCLKINVHSTNFVFMYRKHNAGKTLQHKYRQIYFGNTSEVKYLVTTIRNEVAKHKQTENRIISENFY